MKTYIKLILTAIFWGGTFIAGRAVSQNVDPVNAAFIRFSIASFFLILFTRQLEGKLPRITMRQLGLLSLLGATGVFTYNIFFFKALHHIYAGRAALIIALNPIVISVLSALFFKEKLNMIKGLGIILSVTGALVVISNGHLTDVMGYHIGKGELFIGGCVASWVAYSLIGKSVMGTLSPLVSVCYSSIIGTFFLFIPAVAGGRLHEATTYSLSEWAGLFYLGFFGTVLGFFWYYEGIKAIGPMKASVFINVVPVSAIILAWLILDEPVTSSLFSGAVLVVTGVYATNASDIIRKFWMAKCPRSVSKQLAEDAADLASFDKRKGEPLISYDEMTKRLKKDRKI